MPATGRTFDLKIWPETLEWIASYHKELRIAEMPGALAVRTRLGKPFTKDILWQKTSGHLVREKRGILSEVKLADLASYRLDRDG